jgi:RNA polymerase sigma-70 factor (ECF subfamily)
LVQAARRGDPTATGDLADRHWDRVFAFAYRLAANQTDAEDITQETFLRAFRNLRTYRPDGQFRAWLLRIATNLFLDLRKSAQARDVVSAELASMPASGGARPEDAVDRREIVAAVSDEIQELSHEQRVAFLLRAVEHLEYSEIAGALDVKESTARWHMYEARRLLRARLGKRFELEGIKDDA